MPLSILLKCFTIGGGNTRPRLLQPRRVRSRRQGVLGNRPSFWGKATVESISLSEYALELPKSGVRVFSGEQGTFWISHERLALLRIPVFSLCHPGAREIRRILWSAPAVVASYLVEPDKEHPANASLYICRDTEYSLDKLSSSTRRNVRRGLQELKIIPATLDEVQSDGFEAFSDTRRRAGLTDATLEAFRGGFAARGRVPGHIFLGAWLDNRLVAYLSITEVEDWAEIGSYSSDSYLNRRPNETLIYSALRHYLTERHFRLVSFGLSSLQNDSDTVGLHRFKTKIGFQAEPVHRAFALNPLVRPFVNSATLWGVNKTLQFAPGSRPLRKAAGMLHLLLHGARQTEPAKSSASESANAQ
jgi:hypothetical protein